MKSLYQTIYETSLSKYFWDEQEKNLLINEDFSDRLGKLLEEANEVVFKRFGINPNDKVYFLGGSARLHLYPELLEYFGVDNGIGDLDIIIPDEKYWINAGLEDEYNDNGIFKANESIEVFDVWAPQKAGGAYADVSVRSTEEILKNSSLVNGYYFMSLYDVADYKMKLSRDKEADFVKLVELFYKKPKEQRKIIKKIISLIGIRNTRTLIKF